MNTKIKKITILPGKNKSGEKENFGSIEVRTGESIAIVGDTGAGKSQLLYDIERLAQNDTKSNRTFLVNDKKPDKEMRFNPKRKLIASLAQSMNFLTDMSVKDFLKLHLEARGKDPNQKVITEVVGEANEITGESISYDMNLLNLSGGQSRALMIADVASISDSPIILIDELENAGIKKEKAIEILIKENKIILIVTHDPSLALKANKRIIIKNGGIVQILNTTKKELDIANYLNWIESYNLKIRDKIRLGQEIKSIKLNCKQIG
jgi:ABC-type lipoprotein export system ATPase subunit